MMADRAPQRALGRDRDRWWGHAQGVDPERAQVCPPGRLVWEGLDRMRSERFDHWASQLALAHVAERLVVDHVVLVTRAQPRQEGLAGLRPAGSECREALAADLGRHAVASRMAGARVVHRDEGRTLEPGPQDLLILLGKGVEVGGEEGSGKNLGRVACLAMADWPD